MTLDTYAGLFADDVDSVAQRLDSLMHKCATRSMTPLLICLIQG